MLDSTLFRAGKYADARELYSLMVDQLTEHLHRDGLKSPFEFLYRLQTPCSGCKSRVRTSSSRQGSSMQLSLTALAEALNSNISFQRAIMVRLDLALRAQCLF